MTTLNYTQLIELEILYYKEGLRILLFPCNQFKQQEPKSNPEIKEFIEQFHGNFIIFAKVDINGKNACGLYRYLRQKGGLKGSEIGWNFGKFLVDRSGQRMKYFTPQTEPKKISSEIIKFI